MSFGKKFLIAFFLFISTVSTVHADFIWPAYYFLVAGFIPIWVIIGGLIIETGFVKYFTKVSYRKAILLSVLMNLVSAILGAIFCLIGLMIAGKVYPYTLKILPSGWYVHALTAVNISAVFINTLIEGQVIKLMLKLKFKHTYKWLLVANAISVTMCFIPLRNFL